MFMYRFRSIRRSVPGCVSTESLKIIAASTTPCAGQDLLHGSEVHCAPGPAKIRLLLMFFNPKKNPMEG